MAIRTLIVERQSQQDESEIAPGLAITPRLEGDYWAYRVKLNDTGQAIVGFPKFWTIGIGFAQEEDWNTNLPYTSTTEAIFRHIRRNKGDKSIPDESVREAIRLVQEAITEDRRDADPLAARIDALDLESAREALHWMVRNASREDTQRAVSFTEGR